MSTVGNWRRFVSERLTAAAEEIFVVFEKTVIEYEKEIERQRILLDIVWRPEVKLNRIDQRVCKVGEGLADQQLSNQERISSLVQEEPEPPHIKEEQEGVLSSPEGEQLVVKHEEGSVPSDVAQEASPPLMHGGDGKHEEQEEVFSSPGGEQFVPKQEEDAIPSDVVYQALPPLLMDGRDNKLVEDLQEAPITTPPESTSESHTYKVHEESSSHKSQLVKPMRSHKHKKTFSCSFCGRTFKRMGHLTLHLRTHTGEKPYSCSICKKTFSQRGTLTHHLMTHSGERPFSCSICGRRYKRRETLTVHIRTHTGEKPFPCQFCGNAFSDRGTLISHLRTHTGERPFSCRICGKTFSQRGTLTKHERTHTDEKQFSCSICGERFSQKNVMMCHMRTHTENEDGLHVMS